MQERPLAGSRLGIFGKGGSGKSTVTVFLAGALRRMGYEVAVLDADSTNVGLGKAFGLARDPDPLLEYFGGMVFSGGPVTCPVDDPLPLADASVDRRWPPVASAEMAGDLARLVRDMRDGVAHIPFRKSTSRRMPDARPGWAPRGTSGSSPPGPTRRCG